METLLTDEGEVERARRAGREAARYCTPDPVFWIDRAALAGVELLLLDEGGFVASFLEASFLDAVFLETWLDESPGARRSVELMLRKRPLSSI